MNGVAGVWYWSPRLLSVAFVLFLSLFALDVFTGELGWHLMISFLIHLIPAFVLLVAVAIAWKYDLVGAFIFIGFGLWYSWSAGFDKPWSWYAAIALPPIIVGFLYLVSWGYRKQ